MWNTKVKATAIVLLVVANVAYFYWVRVRRPALPAHMQPVMPLADLTPEQRQERVETAFALDDFDIKPLETESKFVTIPRPEKWREQMVVSTTFVNAGPGKDEDDEATEVSHLPWRAGLIRINVISISVSAYETVPTPEARLVLIEEKMFGHDGYSSKNGIPVPLLELVGIGRYYVDEKDNILHKLRRAVQVNGTPQMNYTSDVPQWLVPKRELAIGETWVQVGANPIGVPDTAPRPEAVRTLNRLVVFEGRQAAEISSTSTFYDFALGPKARPVRREGESLAYLDLETGEPLWYEDKNKEEEELEAVARGCNQIFTKHLIRTPQK